MTDAAVNYIQSLAITARLLPVGMFNITSKKIGGIRFTKIGRFTVSTSISRI